MIPLTFQPSKLIFSGASKGLKFPGPENRLSGLGRGGGPVPPPQGAGELVWGWKISQNLGSATPWALTTSRCVQGGVSGEVHMLGFRKNKRHPNSTARALHVVRIHISCRKIQNNQSDADLCNLPRYGSEVCNNSIFAEAVFDGFDTRQRLLKLEKLGLCAEEQSGGRVWVPLIFGQEISIVLMGSETTCLYSPMTGQVLPFT
ncbi:hypothetical protein ACFE04_021473 [Oxalis oulophora]